ncbi:MAG TPA: N-acetylglutaminylglutamine amidotransferase [Xanthomonadaceae bacterium]|nr:N-acetylglutaminylglutamine amidotransferase [Xanthomonadaceae bacterium]
MCGISGEVRFDEADADRAAVARMMDAMVARGPDAGGAVGYGRYAFGHRRLRIIDLSDAAAQPMFDAALGLTVVFNGCIYNYRELREELQALGYAFFSHGDTEVVLKAWHAWSERCVERFHGMFAFAVYERDSGRFALARDRFGIKPLYYAETKKRMRFASSLPALLAAGDFDTSIDHVALHHYMSFHSVVPPPRTILNGVRKLPPATVRVVGSDGSHRDHHYWELRFGTPADERGLDHEAWADRVLEALRLAVKRRTVADVPVGVLLSGGVDSSLIVALLAEMGVEHLNTFSVGFESVHGESGDEFQYSDLVAERYGTIHHRIPVPSSELLDALPTTIQAMSEPMVSYDNVGFYLLSQRVSQHVKVVQSGQGADEVFAGYHWYPKVDGAHDPVAAYQQAFFDRSHAVLAGQLAPGHLYPNDVSHDYVAAHFARPGAEAAVDKALRLDSTVMLVDDPVKRVDNMTMAFGLEARVPFLDHELVELAARIPASHKLGDGGKGVLKTVARRVLPREVIDRKKGYFPVPALKYLEGPYLEMVRDALGSRAARGRGLYRQDYLDRLLAAPRDHITPLRGSELWQVGLLELWLQQHRI